MNIGDKVRHINGPEEGIVVNLLKGNQVEVEIEEGFVIPFSAGDLTVVSSHESRVFDRKTEAATPAATRKKGQVSEQANARPRVATKGVFLAFEPLNDQEFNVQLINNTDFVLYYTFGKEYNAEYEGTSAGELEPKQFVKIDRAVLSNFEKWGSFMFQLLFFRRGKSKLMPPLVRKHRFSAKAFFKNRKEAPVTKQKAHLFQLDEQEAEFEPEQLKSSMLGKNQEQARPTKSAFTRQQTEEAREIDLHIERLGPGNWRSMKSDEILDYQLNVFEQELDRALLNGPDEIIFIHGVGNGILRSEIHRRLGKHSHVDHFKDARREKFGFGATFVKLK